MLSCAAFVPKLAIAALLSARNTTATTASAALSPVVAVQILAARWLRQWRKSLYSRSYRIDNVAISKLLYFKAVRASRFYIEGTSDLFNTV